MNANPCTNHAHEKALKQFVVYFVSNYSSIINSWESHVT